ncbi:hypothetical protein COS31_03885 [Candidatus Roizmanbacteria bacterium CG02_land_8_20_14_3_00_36_15]|uniref:Uncharacterized protein n=2 Tax=Candidatus Roizmaniibacteriota TaxID=1752723 RepID=A0A2M8KKL4_9BACT|nr:MAG: hypothetical protein COS51_02715 [Candidatus Roizmanbacteria bacterium CG03_land_8_20_14_0_80_36_21]PIV37546.1 MAG: hypothetical protein COS31_03885 [Candidatus Roizmanbacteria bacterium CG02_land_8_20_14_3_00_36_15]PIY70428.1 MAG: hypothetical protein COY89_01295 [Candidatus Roizmanbacteria bacterium CG_4_10_14_0_8_um_filter_36_36]PJA53819.1 MAG: hypothetical protein CO166_00390 [Candidatus Roizmanbacteria bacterium CG_4_9_14_3_um_filter_36_11]PJC81317.1 MAG: hypothetical protein CO007
MKIEELAQEIDLIKKRNQRVEIDKAWETSIVRKILLLVFTYLSIGLYLNAMNIKDPWLNAVVPSIGFLLSTLTLPYFKDLWRRYIYKKK